MKSRDSASIPFLDPGPERPDRPPRPLLPDEIHLWSISLLASPSELAENRALLSADEAARADRFRFERHRRRFGAGRAALRRILALYEETDPRRLTFGYGPHGKPFLTGGSAAGEGGVAFNLSHSYELGLLAITSGEPLGVDVERPKAMHDRDAVARRFFARGEVSRLESLPEEEKTAAFFRCWTRKEAYLKAVGKGLAQPLKSFEVTHEEGADARFLGFDDPAEEAARWSLTHLVPAKDYVGALAIRRRDLSVRAWRWPG